jgi:hypothetical protein
MFAQRPLFGYGLDTFSAKFPRFQSEALSVAFPDSYNESPHNFALDVLLGQGVAGLAPLIAILRLAFSAAGREKDFLRAGLLAVVTSCLFFCFEVTTAVYFYFTLAVLLATPGPEPVEVEPVARDSATIRFCQVWAAALLIVFAGEVGVSDWRYERASRDIAAGDLAASVADYEAGRAWFPLGFNSSTRRCGIRAICWARHRGAARFHRCCLKSPGRRWTRIPTRRTGRTLVIIWRCCTQAKDNHRARLHCWTSARALRPPGMCRTGPRR